MTFHVFGGLARVLDGFHLVELYLFSLGRRINHHGLLHWLGLSQSVLGLDLEWLGRVL